MKNVCIQSYSGPYFPVFGLNTDQNNSEYGHFLHSVDDDHCSLEVYYPCFLKKILGDLHKHSEKPENFSLFSD